ncbi:hypothetical protein [Nonomuraea sp. NPDC049709]|uniref:hypothetical protein n=1 Tax=Nonomuraea sp. NPDC049709 TaxID=3154736 RepID=UPI00341217CE
MEGDRGDAAIGVAAVKFLGEQDVLELGVAVRLLRRVLLLVLQVIDVDVAKDSRADTDVISANCR